MKAKVFSQLLTLLFFITLGVNNAEAQRRNTVVVYLHADVSNGGAWRIKPVSDDTQLYEGPVGNDDVYAMITPASLSSYCFYVDTMIDNRFGGDGLKKALINKNNYEFDGWTDSEGNIVDIFKEKQCVGTSVLSRTVNLYAKWKVPPVLKWTVSTNSMQNFLPAVNNGKTSVPAGTQVYIQVEAECSGNCDLLYDDWTLSYHTSEGISFTDRNMNAHDNILNEDVPHYLPGVVVYTIDNIKFYYQGVVVHTISPTNYSYTIEINEVQLTDPTLYWATSLNNDQNFDYYDENSLELRIRPLESMYLQLNIEHGSLPFDRWDVEYSIESDYFNETFVSPTIANNNFILNYGNPFTNFGNLRIRVLNLTLYNNRSKIKTIPINSFYTVLLTKSRPILPVAKWHAKTNPSGNYLTYSDNSTLTIAENDSVYVGVSIEDGTFIYTSWHFDFTVSPIGNDACGIDNLSPKFSYYFNCEDPYSKFDKLEITIPELILGTDDIGSITIPLQNPFKFTVVREKKEPDKPDPVEYEEPVLEWSADINSSGIFNPYDDNTNISIGPDESITLQICPKGGTYDYNNWSFDYSVTPSDYHIPTGNISVNDCYKFNNGTPYTDFSQLVFSVTGMTLYSGNTELKKIRFDTPYVFSVTKGSNIDPELQWSASVNSNNNFKNYGKKTEITIAEKESVYIRVSATGGTYDYDNWNFEYSINPSKFQNPVSMIAAGGYHRFYNGSPINDFEELQITISSMKLYSGSQEIKVIQFDEPYVFSVKKEADLIDPELQLSVSVNSKNNFTNIGKNTNIKIGEKDSVYLQVCPTGGNYKYTHWDFDYTISPSNFYKQVSTIAGTNCYIINNESPYKNFETLKVELTAMRLYESGRLIKTIQFSEPYIFTAEALNENQDEGVEIYLPDPVCGSQSDIALPFRAINPEHKYQYNISFSVEARNAGFKDITNYTSLPESQHILIDVPEGALAGIYTGVIRFRGVDNNYSEELTFTFQITGSNVAIISQPLSTQTSCNGKSVVLAVAISGSANSYQWYHNDQPIPGANNLTYETNSLGSYYLEITGDCETVRSQTAVVNFLETEIVIKWGDVLYAENSSGKYQRFQWYHNGSAINGATHIYYSDEKGLLGEYTVRCYKSDGSYDEPCPVLFNSPTNGSKANIYPTVLKPNESLNIDIYNMDNNEQVTVEIYSITGILVHSMRTEAHNTMINTGNLTKGSYFVKIKMSSGKIFNEKIIIM